MAEYVEDFMVCGLFENERSVWEDLSKLGYCRVVGLFSKYLLVCGVMSIVFSSKCLFESAMCVVFSVHCLSCNFVSV